MLNEWEGGHRDTEHSNLDNNKTKVHDTGINMVCVGTRERLPEHREGRGRGTREKLRRGSEDWRMM